MGTTFLYDNHGRATWIGQTTTGQPTTGILRTYDGYGQIVNEQVYINGLLNTEVNQQWNEAARRSELTGAPNFPQGQGAGRNITYGYRADGLMTMVNPGGLGYSFNYDDRGLLTSRSNPFRSQTIGSRDGMGRILAVTNLVASVSQLQETMVWRPDGKLTSYVGTRPGFNDARTYGYNYAQVNRLTNETVSLLPGQSPATILYQYDFGAPNGVGLRTMLQMTGGSYNNVWILGNDSSYVDPLRRILLEGENYIARRASVGTAPGVAYLTSTLDGRETKNVDYDPVSGTWRTVLELPYFDSPAWSYHAVKGYHPSGVATGGKTNQYYNAAWDGYQDAYDAFGNQTLHRLVKTGGAVSIAQTNAWDAEGRLIKVICRDDANDGYDWTALYDGLGRRLRTIYTPIISGVFRTNITLTLDSWYDPQVRYLEIALAVNGQRTWKVYGPDLSQGYGMQGTGGFETTVREYDGYSTGLLGDTFGNIVGTITNGVTRFGSRVASYGPFASQQPPLVSKYVSVAEATVWRGKRIDPRGFFWMGARYYEPNAGRFLSPDPLGHSPDCIDLYSSFNGDPVNVFDPDGMFGKGTAHVFDFTWNMIIASAFTPSPEGATPEQIQALAQTGLDKSGLGSPMKNWFGVNYTANPVVDSAPATFGPLVQNAINSYGIGERTATSPEIRMDTRPTQWGAPINEAAIVRNYEAWQNDTRPNQLLLNAPPRPTWQQSETDVARDLNVGADPSTGWQEQQSFKTGLPAGGYPEIS